MTVLGSSANSTEAARPAPIPMLLVCPGRGCGKRHIDKEEFATKPHHTHACQFCGHVWRPAIVDTVGVRFLPGYKNGPAVGEVWIAYQEFGSVPDESARRPTPSPFGPAPIRYVIRASYHVLIEKRRGSKVDVQVIPTGERVQNVPIDILGAKR